jgi:hypothetical protein
LGDFGYNWTTFNLKNWAEKNQVKEQEVVGGKLEPSYSFFEDLSPEAEKFTADQLQSLASNLQQDIRTNRYQHILHKVSIQYPHRNQATSYSKTSSTGQ